MSRCFLRLIAFCVLFLTNAVTVVNHWEGLSDYVFYGGDEWEYQSIAVNFALGNHLMWTGNKFGADAYKFDEKSCVDCGYVQKAFAVFNANNYREPVYPLVVGLYYKLFGIQPRKFKRLQLVLLFIVSLLVPFWGYVIWGNLGYVSGCLAGWLFLDSYAYTADYIMTEALISAVLMAYLAIVYNAAQFRKNWQFVLWGICSGLVMLSKGIFVALPFFFMAYFVTTGKHSIKQMLWTFSALLLVTLAYSYYSSTQTGNFVFITSQGKDVLLASNNEYCLDGHWHPEWQSNITSYYNQQHSIWILDIIGFYFNNPMLFVEIMAAKVRLGLIPLLSFRLLLLLSAFSLFRRTVGISAHFTWAFTLLVFCFAWFHNYFFNFNLNNLPDLVILLFAVFVIIYYTIILLQRSKDIWSPLFWVSIIYPIVVTLAFYGLYRFTMPFEPLSSLFAIHIVISEFGETSLLLGRKMNKQFFSY